MKNALLTLDPLIVLLNLAGYQVPQVAFGIPATGTTPVVTSNLLVVELATMTIRRGTTLKWPPITDRTHAAAVGLWVEPRYAGTLVPGAAGPTCPLDGIADADHGVSVPVVEETFTAGGGTGWLRLLLPTPSTAGGWRSDMVAPTETARARIAQLLAAKGATAQADAQSITGASTWVCGLLSMFDPACWSPAFTPATFAGPEDVGTLVDRVAGLAFDTGESGLRDFLDGESALVPPMTTPSCTDLVMADALDGAAGRARMGELQQALEGVRWALAIGPGRDPSLAARTPPFSMADFSQLSVTRLWMYWQEHAVVDFLGPIEAEVATSLYGGYDLRLGDDDSTRTWGGVTRTAAGGDTVPSAGRRATSPSCAMISPRLALVHSWAGPAAETSEAFDARTAEAVRELQLHAKLMPNLATPLTGPLPGGSGYGETLDAVANPQVYVGPLSGVVNAETRALVSTWRTEAALSSDRGGVEWRAHHAMDDGYVPRQPVAAEPGAEHPSSDVRAGSERLIRACPPGATRTEIVFAQYTLLADAIRRERRSAPYSRHPAPLPGPGLPRPIPRVVVLDQHKRD